MGDSISASRGEFRHYQDEAQKEEYPVRIREAASSNLAVLTCNR